MEQQQKTPEGKYLATLSLTALGVVFGDIGTSPLYALRECFRGGGVNPGDPDNVFGVLSLIFWALLIVVTLKYLSYVMRADNKGEGGELALMSLAHPKEQQRTAGISSAKETKSSRALVYIGLFGASLLYGDGIITPAISVLSAVEGLEVITPVFAEYVVPITAVLLFSLFWVQKKGTNKIGRVFGPVILCYFIVIGILGVRGIAAYPTVLQAVLPWYGLKFLVHEGWHAFIVLGGVFLVVTGSEALYADMGHFGRKPIRIGWFCVALPALLLNYFGQGALILSDPATVRNPFYLLAPSWGLIPLVVLATAATVIASQALISGAFSITRQAVQLGYLPRMGISHTSSDEIGQIYVSLVNRMLLIFTLWLVFEFRTSSNLASAYGIAVSTSMIITNVLMFFVTRYVWHWKLPASIAVTATFGVIDIAFFAANIIKVEHGGWFPLLIGACVFTLMTTWRTGRQILAARLKVGLLPLESFIHGISEQPPTRVPGTAIFLTRSVDGAPPVLLHHMEHNKVLHENVVIMMIATAEIPKVELYDRVQVEGLGHGFFRIVAHYGFMESPNVPEVLRYCKDQGANIDLTQVTYFLGQETIIATDQPGMAIWREELFAFMSRNSERPSEFFKLPRDRIVELGIQIAI